MLNRLKKTFQETQEKRKLAQQEKEEARALELRMQTEKELEQQKALDYLRQTQENILTILNDEKLPDVDWSALGELPFRFQKTEHLIYVFLNVHYAEQRVKREIVGRSAGTSVRIMKGVSVRAGASRGTPVERDEIVDRGLGTMAVTNRHLYFNGQRSFRIRSDKIISVQPVADGVEVTRDRVSALSEYFLVGERDANFAYELLQAIPSLELPRNPERQDPDPSEYHLLMFQGDAGGDDVLNDS
ncbi:MAG: hypothetical protein OXI16_04135 [Chloroflexota bacterium]|nr:hypothetical protein [Chloroflexota bacterium]